MPQEQAEIQRAYRQRQNRRWDDLVSRANLAKRICDAIRLLAMKGERFAASVASLSDEEIAEKLEVLANTRATSAGNKRKLPDQNH